MIKTIKGNLLDIEKGIIVHGCNAQGVMGLGIALQIKTRWPDVYKEYKNFVGYAQSKHFLLGFNVAYSITPDKIIVNAITQEYYGNNGEVNRYVSYDAIYDCFSRVNTLVKNRDLYHLPVCFPKIGCGLGGGSWNIVSTIIDETLDNAIEKRLYIL